MSTFTPDLPAEGARSSAPATILLVEDDDDSREMLAEYLAAHGFEVATAADGLEALRLALTSRPSLLILDLTLPGMSGLEVAARVRAEASMTGTAMMALSGRELGPAERAAFQGVVQKPVNLDRVRAMVSELASRRR